MGGKLSTEWLLDAYRHGIFPWPSSAHEPMLWWSPDPRAILPLDGLHVPRRLKRRLASGEFSFRLNAAFPDVIRACSIGHGREGGTWLTPDMIAAYVELHRQGYAHSVETWQEGRLVGGVYGVALGGLFSAESMFYRTRDASKAALVKLVEHLKARGYQLLDVQQWTAHTGRMGVVKISRSEYLTRVAGVIDLPITFAGG